MRKLLFLAFLLIFTFGTLWADDAPVRNEQTIYSILAYNGRDFSPTFCRQGSNTIFLLADHDSVISLKKAFVYYWPMTEDWRTDSSVLDIAFDGTLEIRSKRSAARRLDQVFYTYFNVRGTYENNWHVATGKDAEAEILAYQRMVGEYMAAADNFRAANREYEMFFDAVATQITMLKNQGKDYSELSQKIQELVQPVEPQPPSYYTAPPAKPGRGFVVNLSPGEYQIRFVDQAGSVVEGSEKRLVVHAPEAVNGIGYSIIPGDKWTRPVDSTTPSSVLYVNGQTDLYINPYYQDRVNNLNHNRMVKNDASGNPNITDWVRIQQVRGGRIEAMYSDGTVNSLDEEPFMVEQTESASLGYRIVPFDPEGAHKGYKPSILGYRIPISDGEKVTRFHLIESGMSAKLTGSERQIRIVNPAKRQGSLLFFILLPMLLMIFVLLGRRRNRNLREPSAALTAE